MTDLEAIYKAQELWNREQAMITNVTKVGKELERAKDSVNSKPIEFVIDLAFLGIPGAIIGAIIGIGPWIGALIGAIVSYFVFYRNKYLKELPENLEKRDREVAALEVKYDALMTELTRFIESPEYKAIISGRVPKRYTSPARLKTLLSYFENHRADSVKEAINLFEAEAKMDAMLNKMAENNKKTSRLSNFKRRSETVSAGILGGLSGIPWTRHLFDGKKIVRRASSATRKAPLVPVHWGAGRGECDLL